jgi:hypothetical protein
MASRELWVVGGVMPSAARHLAAISARFLAALGMTTFNATALGMTTFNVVWPG